MNRKKINLASIVFACVLFTSCSNDDPDTTSNLYLEIPDSRFETLLIEKGIDTDGVVNEQMLKEDALGINKLELEFVGTENSITDLTGLEGFTDLTYLAAERHDITQIDLSANINLDTIYLGGNHIRSIDLSNNSNLILVDIQSNDLDEIEGLASATKLIELELSWNYFEEFSIHNNTLEVLHFSHNDLKSINTDGAINLKHIFMPLNQLSSVDFSTNTAIETLLISGNKIENLNLEHNSNLTHLYITSNVLKGLDVSQNLKLEDLRIFSNPDLTCIKIENGQFIPFVSKSDYQELGSCD